VLPKAAAITVGGLAGFALGMRRYGPRRFLYALGGLTMMTAFCYPAETIRLVRTGVAHSQMAWANFKQRMAFILE
jgi:hypothetical protein